MSVRSNLLLAAATATVVACAGGSDANTAGGADAGPGTTGAESTGRSTQTITETTGISATGGPLTSSSTSESSTSGDGLTTDSGEESTTTASTGIASTTGTDAGTGTGDASTETGTDAGTDTDGCDLITPDTTCELGVPLTAVSGDDGSQVSETGSGSTWFLVQVQETNASIFEEDLSYTVQLESPPGVDYDVFVYEGPQDGDPDCEVTPVQGVGEGGLETVSAGWDDDQGIGGEDDSLWLAIEIVLVTGSDCAAEWTLTVTGGT